MGLGLYIYIYIYLLFLPAQEIIRIKHENLTIGVATQIGGRIASFQYNGKEVLQIDRDDEHFMWGSTLWPAPQHAWSWPPPPAMDKMPYKIVEHSRQKIKVCSKRYAYQGLQLCKTITTVVGTSAFNITYTFINHGSKNVAAGLWENTRVPFDGEAYWLNDSTGDLSTLTFKEELSESNKIFIDFAKPVLAYTNHGLLFIKVFPIVNSTDVAPKQSLIEIYYDPKNKFVELENHSKYTNIAPGAEVNYKVTWHLMPLKSHDAVKKVIAEMIQQ